MKESCNIATNGPTFSETVCMEDAVKVLFWVKNSKILSLVDSHSHNLAYLDFIWHQHIVRPFKVRSTVDYAVVQLYFQNSRRVISTYIPKPLIHIG